MDTMELHIGTSSSQSTKHSEQLRQEVPVPQRLSNAHPAPIEFVAFGKELLCQVPTGTVCPIKLCEIHSPSIVLAPCFEVLVKIP